MSDVGATDAFLINVCSYPSQEPNSDPSDCVVTPDSGFLTIIKETGTSLNPQDPDLTFNFQSSRPSQNNVSSWSVTLKAGTTKTVQPGLIPFEAGSLNLSETGIPTNWKLSSAGCVVSGGSTGSLSGTTINNVQIGAGLQTTCTFTNSPNQGTIELKKVWVGGAGSTLLKIERSDDSTLTSVTANGVTLTTGPWEVDIGTYKVSEIGGLGDYDSKLTCIDTAHSNEVLVNAESGTGPRSVQVDEGDVIECTFTNTKRGNLKIVKKSIGGAADFTFPIGGGPTPISPDKHVDTTGHCAGNTCTHDTGLIQVKPGTYSINETVPAGDPAWTFTTVTCDGGTPGTTPELTADDTTQTTLPISVPVGASATVTCTFTNVQNAEMPVVKKDDSETTLQPGGVSFLLLLFPDSIVGDQLVQNYNPNDTAVAPPDSAGGIKGSAIQISIPTPAAFKLPIDLSGGAFNASFCETGFPPGWTFKSWKVTIQPFGGGAATVLDTAAASPTLTKFFPESPSQAVVCVSFSIPQGTDTVTMELVNIRPAPGLLIVKKVKKIEYEYLVTNTGNVTIKDIAVKDATDDPGVLNVSCPNVPVNGLDASQSTTCTATYEVPDNEEASSGSVKNTAHAEGKDPADDTIESENDTALVQWQSPAP